MDDKTLYAWVPSKSTITIFFASLRSIGTACTLALMGVYLHRRGFIFEDGKRTLALISQQVTIPLLFFTKIINCNQDYSTEACPDVMKTLHNVWMLLVWPFYVVSIGMIVGYVVSCLSKTPRYQRHAVLVACGFGNSTGLPITLLTVVHANFPASTNMGRIDPCLLLSVYLLVYPALQWGVGGLLLQSTEKSEESDVEFQNERTTTSIEPITSTNILGDPLANYHLLQQGEVSEVTKREDSQSALFHRFSEEKSMVKNKTDFHENDDSKIKKDLASIENDNEDDDPGEANINHTNNFLLASNENPSLEIKNDKSLAYYYQEFYEILGKILKPPVVGSLFGLFVASIPSIRRIFVDLRDRDDDAPLEFLFDGLYVVGQAAVPINMMILGANLSAAFQSKSPSINSEYNVATGMSSFSKTTIFSIVIGKLLVMPMIGFASVYLFRAYIWNIPDDIAGSFYLVVMIVFLTPTANNVMVMVELSGCTELKKSIARVIAWQYVAGPILLTFTLTFAVGIADQWS